MAEFEYLKDLVVILAIAVGVVVVLSRFRLPPIAGFILAGMIVGPQSLAVIDDVHQVEILAEVGVALLLFGIGLELSLDRLKRLWWPILYGGALQVGLTIGLTFAIASAFGLDWRTALLLGFLVAVSSTAIVLRGLEARGELEAPHGRLTLGILVFQDLCVVPMMLAIPLLSGENLTATEILSVLGRTLVIIAAILAAAYFAVPRAMRIVARSGQRHLFVVTVLLVCIGTAYLLNQAGVSLALGAFLAGLVVAGSEFRYQAMADVISFREVFSSLFFVSVGMLLAPRTVIENIVPILVILSMILVGKFLVVWMSGTVMRLPMRVGVLAAAALAQVGEFSFVLGREAAAGGLFVGALADNVFAAIVLSMFITPFAIAMGPSLAAGVGRIRTLTRLLNVTTPDEVASRVQRMDNHVIVGGYGFAGRELCRALGEHDITYIVVELNVDNIRTAVQAGHPAVFGDVTSEEVLRKLGAERARELILVINDPSAVERSVKAARRISGSLHIVVRVRFLADVRPLLEAGASVAIPAEREAAAEVAAEVLRRYDVADQPKSAILARIRGYIEE